MGAAVLLAVSIFVPSSVRPALAASCSITATMQFGTRTGQVACLEARLIRLGFDGVEGPDLFFGLSTRAAVLDFQADRGLGIDGIVGPKTLAALVQAGQVPAMPAVATVPAAIIEERVIGASVQGRDITAVRMGTPGGRVVLIVGVIHGDEVKGAEITAALRLLPTPVGIDLWLIDSINPDGQASGTRENHNGVDLNRNFENGWSYIAPSTEHHQYSGEAPADQPETFAVQAFIRQIQPSVGIWYHQDANAISTSGTHKEIPLRYGELVGLSPADVPCSQRCTGTAGSFANSAVAGSTNFLVELPGSELVTAEMIARHAAAVLEVVVL